MRFQAGIQIILLITAVVIVFTVIKPKFEAISQTQSEVVSYRTAVENIGQYNARLQSLMNEASSIPAEDLAALYRYLPEAIDAVAVGRDIYNIVASHDMLLIDVVPGEVQEVVTDNVATATVSDPGMSDPAMTGDTGAFVTNSRSLKVMSSTFDVSMVGSYEDMKAVLQDIEKNDYPLRVKELSFDVSDAEDTDLVEYSMVLETYSLAFQ